MRGFEYLLSVRMSLLLLLLLMSLYLAGAEIGSLLQPDDEPHMLMSSSLSCGVKPQIYIDNTSASMEIDVRFKSSQGVRRRVANENLFLLSSCFHYSPPPVLRGA